MERDLNSLREKFCQGEKEKFWEMLYLIFPKLLLSPIPADFQQKANFIGELTDDLFSKPNLLCETELEVRDFFESELQKRIKKSYRPPAELELKVDQIESEKVIESIVEQKEKIPKEKKSLALEFFKRSLSAVEQILYEIRYKRDWAGSPNIRRLQLFLVNTISFGNYSLGDGLKKNPSLRTSEISDWFIDYLKKYFLGNKNEVEPWKDYSESLKNMVNQDVENTLRTLGQKLSRRELIFQKKLSEFKFNNWSEVEVIFYMLHEYGNMESYLEMWFQMNIEAQFYPPLKKNLIKNKLWEKGILSKNEGLREHRIIKRMKLLDKDIKKIKNELKKIQEQISKKSQSKIKWNTY